MGRLSWLSSIRAYPPKDVRAVMFKTEKDLERALTLFWDQESKLYGVPRDGIGGRIIVLPLAVLQLLEKRGIRFAAIPVGSQNEVSAERMGELRKDGLRLPTWEEVND